MVISPVFLIFLCFIFQNIYFDKSVRLDGLRQYNFYSRPCYYNVIANEQYCKPSVGIFTLGHRKEVAT